MTLTGQIPSRTLLYTGIVLSMFTWGLSWPSGKVLSEYGSPMTIALCRYIVVFLGLLPLLVCYRVPLTIKKNGFPLLAIAGILMALYSYVFFEGLTHGLPGAGGVLATTLNPILAYALGLLLNRKVPAKNEALGLFIGLLAGAVLLKVWGNMDELLSSGNLYFLAGALIWVVMSRITSGAFQYGSSLSFSLWMYLLTVLLLMPFIEWNALQETLAKADVYFWSNILLSGFFSTSLATTFYFYATTQLGAEKASGFIFLVPVSAAVSSWLFLGETLQLHTMIGGAMGIIAVVLMNRKRIAVTDERQAL